MNVNSFPPEENPRNSNKRKRIGGNDKQYTSNKKQVVMYLGDNEQDQAEYQDTQGQVAYQDTQGQAEYQDTRGQAEYQDAQGQAEYPDTQGQAEYQDIQDQAEYIDTEGQAEYQDTQGQAKYPDTRGQAEYQETRGQAEYQETQGQVEYQDAQGQAEYHDTQGQAEYQDAQGQTKYPDTQDQAEYPDTQGQAEYPDIPEEIECQLIQKTIYMNRMPTTVDFIMCNQCPRLFRTENLLWNHIKGSHMKRRRAFQTSLTSTSNYTKFANFTNKSISSDPYNKVITTYNNPSNMITSSDNVLPADYNKRAVLSRNHNQNLTRNSLLASRNQTVITNNQILSTTHTQNSQIVSTSSSTIPETRTPPSQPHENKDKTVTSPQYNTATLLSHCKVTSQQQNTVTSQYQNLAISQQDTGTPQQYNTGTPQQHDTGMPQQQNTVTSEHQKSAISQQIDKGSLQQHNTGMPTQHNTETSQQHNTETSQQHNTVTSQQHTTVTSQQHTTVTSQQHNTVTSQQQNTEASHQHNTGTPQQQMDEREPNYTTVIEYVIEDKELNTSNDDLNNQEENLETVLVINENDDNLNHENTEGGEIRDKKYKCWKSPCEGGQVFDSKERIEQHLLKEHATVQTCDICGAKVNNFWKHKQSVHKIFRSFECPHCDTQFCSQPDLERHLRNIDSKNEVKYEDKEEKPEAETHQDDNTLNNDKDKEFLKSVQSKVYPCAECGWETHSNTQYIQHVLNTCEMDPVNKYRFLKFDKHMIVQHGKEKEHIREKNKANISFIENTYIYNSSPTFTIKNFAEEQVDDVSALTASEYISAVTAAQFQVDASDSSNCDQEEDIVGEENTFIQIVEGENGEQLVQVLETSSLQQLEAASQQQLVAASHQQLVAASQQHLVAASQQQLVAASQQQLHQLDQVTNQLLDLGHVVEDQLIHLDDNT